MATGLRYWTPQGTLERPPAAVGLGASVEALLKVMAQPGFAASIDAQADVIAFMRIHRDALATHRDLEGKLRLALRDSLGESMPSDRLAVIFTLDRTEDIRAALQRTYHEPRPRAADEELYPTTGWLGGYLEHARESNAPIGFHFWCGAATLGAALRRNLYATPGYMLFPNLYVLLIGPTGRGKGASTKYIRPILDVANHEWELGIRAYYQWVKGFPDRRVKLFSQDITPEKFIEQLRAKGETTIVEALEAPLILDDNESCGMLVVEELVDLAGLGRHNPAAHFHNFTSLYNCETRTKATRGYGEEDAPFPALSYVLGSTIEWINRAIPEDMHEGGFTNRNIICYRIKLGFEESPDLPVPDPVKIRRLGRALAPWMMMRPSEAVLDKGARALWRDLYARKRMMLDRPIMDQVDQRLANYWQRKLNHVMKTAMLLLASDLTPDDLSTNFAERVQLVESSRFVITDTLLDWAIRIVEYEEEDLPVAMSLVGQTKDAQALERALRWLRKHPASNHSVWMKRLQSYGDWVVTAAKINDQLIASGTIVKHWRRPGNGPGTWCYSVADAEPSGPDGVGPDGRAAA